MASYGAIFSRNMTIGDAVLAGLILRDDMGIPESEWQRLGLAAAPDSEQSSAPEAYEPSGPAWP